LRKNLVSLAT